MRSNLHYILHDIVRYLGFYFRLPYHLILHDQDYGFNRGFILCVEPCGYCFDAGYAPMNCRRCYDYEHERVNKLRGVD